jgi:hypothetical protein
MDRVALSFMSAALNIIVRKLAVLCTGEVMSRPARGLSVSTLSDRVSVHVHVPKSRGKTLDRMVGYDRLEKAAV